MDITSYQTAAARTMRPDEVMHDGEVRFARDSALHFALGLAGEAGELSDLYLNYPLVGATESFVKEIGDTCWYIAMGATLFEMDLHAIACRAAALKFHHIDDDNPTDLLLSLGASAAKISERIKKAAFFGHELDFAQIESLLSIVWWHIPHLARIFGVTVDHILDANIEKLRKRYPEGFTQLASINRED